MADDPLEFEPDAGDPRRPRSPYYPPNVPPATATFGMWLAIASFFMLFAAVMVAYLVIRLAGANSPPLHQIQLPKLLWLSTVLVIAVSCALVRALHYIKLEKQVQFRHWLTISVALAVGFILVQTPAMVELVAAHQRLRQHGFFLYGLVFFLIIIHAIHVLGGIVWMPILMYRARQGFYDHERYQAVSNTALYWHFLDIVWIVMFVTFLVIG